MKRVKLIAALSIIIILVCLPAMISAQTGHDAGTSPADEPAVHDTTGDEPAADADTATAPEEGAAAADEATEPSAAETEPATETETHDTAPAAHEGETVTESGVEPAHAEPAVHGEEPAAHGEAPMHVEDPAAHEAEAPAHGEATGAHGEAAHGEAGEHGGEHGNVMLMFLFTCINFVLFVLLLFFVLRKPVGQALKDRAKNIAKDIEDSERLLLEAKERNAEVRARIERLDAEIGELREQMRKDGEEQGDLIIERSRQMVERIKEDTKFQAEQQVKMARMSLQEEAAKLAVQTAEEILRKSVTDEDHNRLVGQFLQEVKD